MALATAAIVAATIGGAAKIIGGRKAKRSKRKRQKLQYAQHMAALLDARRSQLRAIANLKVNQKLERQGLQSWLISRGLFGGPSDKRRSKILNDRQTRQTDEAQQNLAAILRGETYAVVSHKLAKREAKQAYLQSIYEVGAAVAGTAIGSIGKQPQALSYAREPISRVEPLGQYERILYPNK